MSFLSKAKQPGLPPTPECSSGPCSPSPWLTLIANREIGTHQPLLRGSVDALFIAQLLPTPAISSQELPTRALQITTLGLFTQSREGKSKNTFVCSQPEVKLFLFSLQFSQQNKK